MIPTHVPRRLSGALILVALAAAAFLSPPGAAALAAGGVATGGRTVENVVPRFQQVDERLFRGGQPDRTGFEALRRLGVRTIVNLRSEHDERALVEELGLKYVQIPVPPAPFGVRVRLPDAAVRRFFAVVDDPVSGRVFVHCRRGADRTGVAVGLYRIARQQWEASAAFEEARRIGMRWWYVGFKAQLMDFSLPAVP